MDNNEQDKISRKEQAVRTRRKLFDTGLRIFAEKDMDEVCIKDICGEAGVSVGTFYHYFSSKEDLLLEAYRFFDEEIVSRARGKAYPNTLEAIYAIIGNQCGDYGNLFEGDFDSQIFEIMCDYESGELLLWQQELRIQLKTGGVGVIEADRPMNTYILELVKRAFNDGELVGSLEPSEIAETILRISRGVMFDWAVRGGTYKAYERAISDVKGYLKAFLPA